MTSPSKVFVSGATGAVGPRVVEALLDAGHMVRTFSLDAIDTHTLPKGADHVIGDITNFKEVRSALFGCNAVIHLAALVHEADPSMQSYLQYDRINIGGTSTVVNAAIEAHIERLVYFSTINVYGPTRGKIVTETFPTAPDTFYARTKLSAEKFVLEAHDPNGAPIGVVLRLGTVYGSRIKGNYNQLLHALAKHRFIPIGSGHNRRTLVYDKDVANAAVLALMHPKATGNIYNVTDGTFHPVHEILSTLSSCLGKKTPTRSLPVRPVRLIAGLLEGASHVFGFRSPVSRSTIDKYIEDIAVDGSRIQRELGFSPRYDLMHGWEETISELRRWGQLD